MSDTKFCPMCDVSLDLHDGPASCHIAAQREFIIALPFALAVNR